jgi:hypothetical protein
MRMQEVLHSALQASRLTQAQLLVRLLSSWG